MPFAAKSIATQKNGKIKKGFKMITDRNGRERYMTDVKAAPKKKEIKQMGKTVEKNIVTKGDVKPVVKKVKKEVVKTEKAESKGVSKKKVKKEIEIDSDDEGLTLNF